MQDDPQKEERANGIDGLNFEKIRKHNPDHDRGDDVAPRHSPKMSVKPYSWISQKTHFSSPKIINFMNEEAADRVLLAAAVPDFFIFEDDDERAEAMLAVVHLVQRMPREWGEKARPVLEESAAVDAGRCRRYAAEALAVLNRGWFQRAWQALLSQGIWFFSADI